MNFRGKVTIIVVVSLLIGGTIFGLNTEMFHNLPDRIFSDKTPLLIKKARNTQNVAQDMKDEVFGLFDKVKKALESIDEIQQKIENQPEKVSYTEIIDTLNSSIESFQNVLGRKEKLKEELSINRNKLFDTGEDVQDKISTIKDKLAALRGKLADLGDKYNEPELIRIREKSLNSRIESLKLREEVWKEFVDQHMALERKIDQANYQVRMFLEALGMSVEVYESWSETLEDGRDLQKAKKIIGQKEKLMTMKDNLVETWEKIDELSTDLLKTTKGVVQDSDSATFSVSE